MLSKGNSRDGYVMIAVVAFSLFLIPVIIGFTRSIQSASHQSRASIDKSRLEFLALGLSDAVAYRAAFDRTHEEKYPGNKANCRYGNDLVIFSVEEHSGKIDINHAGSALLMAGFRAMGFGEPEAGFLQGYVESYRSGQSTAESNLSQAELSRLKGAPFENVEELNDIFYVKGFSPGKLPSFFSAYRRSRLVNINAAQPELRDFILSDQSLAENAIEQDDEGEPFDVLINVKMSGKDGVTLRNTYRNDHGDIRLLVSTVGATGAETLGTKAPVENRVPLPECMALLGFGSGLPKND
ncbi:hypothetical protein [Rhizobium alvei]|uniref:General secretion pathway protein K n=1 Tax=Rhizobium alvei TaxID=1132659 RepID=A0ABT8YPL1_9HYPH|nr:hypothetical protein [Rhizobium alvei]MDO6965242.1 hypothetical protein [Rhizobium alvei]